MRTLLVLVAALALVASAAVEAQQGGGGGRGAGGGGRGAGGGGAGGGAGGGGNRQPGGPGAMGGFNRGMTLAEYVTAMKLTDDQKDPVKEIFNKEKEAHDQWDKDNATAVQNLRDKMQQAGQDRTARQAAMDDMQKLMERRNKPIQDDTIMKLGNVLTGEQMAQVKQFVELQAMSPQAAQLMATLEKVDLTDDQKSKVMSMIKETNEKAQADRTARTAAGGAPANPPAAGQRPANPWQTLQDDISNNVLTTEQKAKFAELQRTNRPQPPAGGAGGAGGGNRGNRGGGGAAAGN